MHRINTVIAATILLGLLGYVMTQGEALAQKSAEQSQNMVAPADMPAMIDELINKINKDIASTGEIFNSYFNKEFFRNAEEPFKEIEKRHAEMMKRIGKKEREIFGKSWDSWYEKKFGTSGIIITKEENRDSVIMIIRAAEADDNKLNVSVNNRLVNIEYDIKKMSEARNEKDKMYSSSLVQEHVSKILPVPDNADAGSARIESGGNEVVITFPKIVGLKK
jgi:HSP20 family molecular chaperone IbpA